MKTLTIHSRTILTKTGYRESPQYVVEYDGNTYRNGHSETIGNPRLKIPFRVILKTRSKAELSRFISKPGKTNADKWLSALLGDILDYEAGRKNRKDGNA